MRRRQFVKHLAWGSSLLVGTTAFQWKLQAPLKILVLGGTQFLGPAVVNAALQQGHHVTLLNRGVTNPNLFANLPLIKADRQAGISAYSPALSGDWDAIIDVWPEKSALVDQATQAFKDHNGYYVFISSIAVYNNFQEVGLHENSATVSLELDPSEWYYSEEKLRSEQLVQERFPEKHLILRPGPIKGWRDPALDLLYWLVKLQRHEPMLLPGSGMDPLQFIDVKAVAKFAINSLETERSGVYNTTGPREAQLNWKEFINIAHEHLQSQSSLHWAPESFLKENGVRSFEDLPLWAPLSEDPGFMQISMSKAQREQFQHIPITDTINDCLKWFEKNYSGDYRFGNDLGSVGLTLQREQELISQL